MSTPTTPSTIRFDAHDAALVLDDSAVRSWGRPNPAGAQLGANNYFLTLDGRPFPIVSGELIMQRYPRGEWAEAIAALRAGGCTMVSSYLFWSLVEPTPGRFDFTGQNDIRTFAQLCADHGMLFAPRIGPFNNSEFLLGGLPPWLYGMPLTERSNDPAYLDRVGAYFDAVAGQLEGLYWQDGGSIVVVQLENELSHAPNDWSTLFGYTATDHRGPEGEEFTRHMETLQELARSSGIRPPYFAMTGWRTAGDVPDGFLPSYAGYMDLHHRPGANNVLTTFTYADYPYRGRLPVIFSELGTGSPARAAYRPMTPTPMTVTTALTRLGSVESIFLGYYMFHGGTNPVRGDGFGWMTKEPAFALRSYDFWAPVSEFGERRDSFYALNLVNRFVQDFGAELADMQVVHPDDPVTDPDDDRVRTVIRSDGNSAFVFISNYGNNIPLGDRKDVRFDVTLRDETMRFPRHEPLQIAAGDGVILPVALDLGADVVLASGLAWPIARMSSGTTKTTVLAAVQGRTEYVLRGVRADDLAVPEDSAIIEETDGVTVIFPASDASTITVSRPGGLVKIVTISRDQARHLQSFGEGAHRVLVTSPDEFDGTAREITVSRRRELGESFDVGSTVSTIRADGAVSAFEITLPPAPSSEDALVVERLSETRVVITAAPGASADSPDPLPDLWADIAYTGDLCRLFDAETGLLIGDDFNRGIPWRLKLGRFSGQLRSRGVQLRAEPIARKESIIDPTGILLDNVTYIEGVVEIRDIRLTQTVRVPVALRPADQAGTSTSRA